MELMTETEASKTEEAPKKPESIKYDPAKRYKWEHTDEFTISGTEFGAAMNSLGTFLSIYGPQVELAKKAYEGLQKALEKAVSLGIAVELKDKPEE